MRYVALVLALAVGFLVMANGPQRGARLFAIAVCGVMSGFTLTVSDYVINGVLDDGDRKQLARDRGNLVPVDWGGRLIGFGLLAWVAWRKFGHTNHPSA